MAGLPNTVGRFAFSIFLGAALFSLLASAATVNAQEKPIDHDAQYYILDAQNGERWAAEDKDLDARLAALRQKYGRPPNIIHLMWDDQPFGAVGIPALQQIRGYDARSQSDGGRGHVVHADVFSTHVHARSSRRDDRPDPGAQRHVQGRVSNRIQGTE